MTARAALREARKRWGRHAWIEYDRSAPMQAERIKLLMMWKSIEGWPKSLASKEFSRKVNWRWLSNPCRVGKMVGGMIFEVRGEGDTFELAFEDADKRQGMQEIIP